MSKSRSNTRLAAMAREHIEQSTSPADANAALEALVFPQFTAPTVEAWRAEWRVVRLSTGGVSVISRTKTRPVVEPRSTTTDHLAELRGVLSYHATSLDHLPPFLADRYDAAADVLREILGSMEPLTDQVPGISTTADVAPFYYAAMTGQHGWRLDDRNAVLAPVVHKLTSARLLPDSELHLVTVLHKSGRVSILLASLAEPRSQFARPNWHEPANALFYIDQVGDWREARDVIEDVKGAMRVCLAVVANDPNRDDAAGYASKSSGVFLPD